MTVGGAVTSAQEGDGPIGTFLARVADKLGLSEEDLSTAVEQVQSEMMDEAVAEGRLTQEQADRLRERAAEGGFLFPFGGPGPGHAWGGPHGVVPEAAAEVLGMTQAELMEQLRDGSSLAEVAEAKGVADFQSKLLAEVRSQLDGLVADGTLTQDQADNQYQRIEENIDSIVNAEGCGGRFGGPHPRPGRFGGPWFGPPSEETPENTELSGVSA
jgi:polyhydroxyalkanoate synthesis regulator phasin